MYAAHDNQDEAEGTLLIVLGVLTAASFELPREGWLTTGEVGDVGRAKGATRLVSGVPGRSQDQFALRVDNRSVPSA